MVKADKNDVVRLERLKNEPERMEEYIEFVFPEADVSVVKAVKYDAIRLERLKNEPERIEEYLNFKKALRKSLCRTSRVSSFYFFLFFEPIPIFSYFSTKNSSF